MYRILCYILFICLLSPFAVSVVYTQNSIPTHTADGKYIREWLVLGPFFPDDLKTDFLTDMGGEANVVPKEGDSITTTDGRTLKWKRYISNEDSINFVKAIGDHEKATAYAFCILQSEYESPCKALLGSDDGVAVWLNGELVHQYGKNRPIRFDEDIFLAVLKTGDNRCLVKVSQVNDGWGFALRAISFPPDSAVLSGVISNEAGQPIFKAFLCLEQNGMEAAHTRTDASGKYKLIVHPANGNYDLSAIADNLGDWQLRIPLSAGECRKLDMKLKENISISGEVMTLENGAPLANILVQAVAVDSMPKLIFAALSGKEGKYQIKNMRPGCYQVWCRIPGGDVYYGEKKNTPPILQVERGKTLKDINFRFIYSKNQFQRKAQSPSPTVSVSSKKMTPLKPFFEEQAYTAKVGVESVRSVIVDAQGYTWFSLVASSIEPHFRRFDGKRFTEVEDVTGSVMSTYPFHARDSYGRVWIAGSKGVARLWNGKVEKYFTIQDGLPSNTIRGIMADKTGGIWISTDTGISYIHKENGVYKITPVVDSISRPYMKVDSEDGLWWIETPGITNIKRLIKTPQGFSRTLKIQFPSEFPGHHEVFKSGFLFKVKNGTYVYFRADGMGHTLDSRFTNFLGSDPEGELYFATEAGEGYMKIVRDEPDSEGNFGYSTSPAQFEFSMKLSTSYRLEQIRNEMWLFSWIADKPVLVIRGNEIIPAKDIYLSELMLGGYFMSADDETIWAREWGKREVMELYFPKGIEFEICPLEVNGLIPLQYNHETGSYYFIFQSPDFTNDSIISYQNREWRELIKLKSQDFSYQTDTSGNTWIAENSSHLICITSDGNIEQQSAQFKIFSPDDRGGCYLLSSKGFGILDSNSRMLQWSNAGQPCPLIKRGKEVFEFKSDGQLPLGMMPEIAYPDWELELQAGDIIIFYTDGIIEAENKREEIYSIEKLEQIIANMNSTMKAEEIIEFILKDVAGFAGNKEQYDDMTIVVVKKL